MTWYEVRSNSVVSERYYSRQRAIEEAGRMAYIYGTAKVFRVRVEETEIVSMGRSPRCA